jgi:hypothetical protein
MTATRGEARGEEQVKRALVISLAAFAVIATVVLVVVWSMREPQEQIAVEERKVSGPRMAADVSVEIPAIVFTDVTAAAGIDFVHENGAYGERLLPETMGGGVAFLDYDNDGDQDLFLVNSKQWPGQEAKAVPTSKLYRNRGDGTFEDVSRATGTDLVVYGMGVAVADFDADGFVDLFVSAVAENKLLKNEGGERFVDVTAAAGVAGDPGAWSTSAGFFDYDRDGDLDLYVANYVEWSPEIDRAVDYQLTGIGRAYGPPTDYAGSESYLYRNDLEEGRFVDVSATAGVHVRNATTGAPAGKALAVHPVDVNADGRLDLIVANDTVRNFLFINEGDGFAERGIDAGLAFDTAGLATGAMGIDVAHFANDERLAVLIGNFANEMSSFYVTRGGANVFSDDAIVAGIGAPSRRALTFGLAFLDIDLDGRLDVLAANGHVEPDINKVQSSQQYEQSLQIFWNCGSACPREYRLVEQEVGRPMAGRGAAYADIDGDGDLDVLVTAVGGRPMLLRNDTDLGHGWLRLRLRDRGVNRDAIGARVTLTHQGIVQSRSVMPTRSYLSQVELPVSFGLGSGGAVAPVDVEVVWPDGAVETWSLEPNALHELVRGEGG